MFLFHRQCLMYMFTNRYRHHPLRRHSPGRHKVRLFAGPVRGDCLSTNANNSFCPVSGDPFVTQIGIGKVIRGWDEGES
jgi:hypothetical protein